LNKKKPEAISQDEMIAKGLINVLALGYRGIELWRSKREPLEKKKVSDEKEN
tara:strand:- start:5 stop:160 length:156 start_codon:yes stop_codon:yes gene_type:complete